jgi:hypothetical protein
MTEMGGTPSGGAHERGHEDELRQQAGRWSGSRPLQDEIPDDLLVENEETEDIARPGPARGISIATAIFVPTFLATFFGVAYLAGVPMGTRSLEDLKGGPPPVVSALAPQRGFIATPPPAQAPTMSSERLTRAVGHADEPPRLPSPPTREAPGNAAVPATTPAIPRSASRPTRPQLEPKEVEPKAEPKRSASTVTKDDAWIRGAAFSDQDSAERLAASIERQGYPAKVRRDDTPITPWVVWIVKHPREMTPSERRK